MKQDTSYISAGGNNIYCELVNKHFLKPENPVLVFLHQGLGSTEQWREFPGLISDMTGYCALLYDRYGYGRSDALGSSRHFGFMHDEGIKILPEILDKLGITNRVILIGHSDGGSIALIYASEYPENISAIITMAAHVIVEKTSVEGARRAVEMFEQGGLYRILNKHHKEKTKAMFYGWADIWLSPEFLSWTIIERLGKIKAPVLAIQGRDDEYGTEKQVELIVKNVSGTATPLMIDNCGHTPFIQHQQLVVQKITEFLKKF